MNSDSIGPLHITGNATFSSRTKHIALHFFFLLEMVKSGRITIHKVGTHDMLTYVRTKNLAMNAFNSIIQRIKYFSRTRGAPTRQDKGVTWTSQSS